MSAGTAYAADEFTPAQTTAIEEVLKSYLNEHPEIIIESVENYRRKQEEEMQAKAQDTITDKLAWLTAKEAPSAGNPDGDVTIVEFFDYNCGYCKRALPDIQEVLKTDKNVRVVFREMPILSPESRTIAQWALAAHKQGKYFEYHVALMNTPGGKDIEALKKIAQDTGLDVEKLEKDANSKEVTIMLQDDMQIAQDIGIQGTPAFIINGELFPGYLGPDGLKASIEEARKKGDKEG
jgi:protein-disulfide isomerase